MTTEEDTGMVDKRAASRMKDGEAPATPPPPGSEELAAQLAAATARAEENLRNWQRSAADFANYRRRTEQEKAETARYATAALVINLLPVYDDLDRAVGTVDAALAGLVWVQGVVAIQRKFAALLEALKVTEINAAGEPFDPNRHEAVGKQPGPEGAVLHVVQKGYLLDGHLIRPAMVIVGGGE